MNVGKKALSLLLSFSMVASTFLSAGGFAAKSSRSVQDSHDSNGVTAYIKDKDGNAFADGKITFKDSEVTIHAVAGLSDDEDGITNSYAWNIVNPEDTTASDKFVISATDTKSVIVSVKDGAAPSEGDSAKLKVSVTRNWNESDQDVSDSKWTKTAEVTVVYQPDAPTQEKLTVVFDLQASDATGKPDDQQIDKDEKAAKPADPSRDGFLFGGWYKEAACTNAWDFTADAVTSDITLYAKWTPETAPTIPVEGVTLNKNTTSLQVGDTEVFVATVTPETATNPKVSWMSNRDAVAAVDENGTVTALAAGTAEITVTTEDGAFTATCVVTVTAEPEPPVEDKATTVTINEGNLTLEQGKSQQFTAAVKDADGNVVPNAAIKWGVTGGFSAITSAGFLNVNGTDDEGTTLTVTAEFAGATGYKASETSVTVTIKKTDAAIYRVSFWDGITELAEMSVIKGEALKAFPDAPVKEGYTFKGWYTSATGTTLFPLDTKINKDTKVYAQYTENATVTFMANGKEYAIASVEAGKTVKAPADPIAPADKAFKGWYEDGATKQFDFTTVLKEGQKLTLTAVFADVYKVKFYSNDGKFMKMTEAVDGEIVTPPEVPSNLGGATFIGWYDEAGVQFKGGQVKSNLNLTATYATPKADIVEAAKNDIKEITKVTPEQIKNDSAVKAAVIEAVTTMDNTQKSKLASDTKALAAVEENYIAAAGIAVAAPFVAADVQEKVSSAAITGAALSAKPGDTVNLAVASAETNKLIPSDDELAKLANASGNQKLNKVVKLDFAVEINGLEEKIGAPVHISIKLTETILSSSKLLHFLQNGTSETVPFTLSMGTLNFTVSSLSPFAIVELKKTSGGGGSSSSSDSDSSSNAPTAPVTPVVPATPVQETLAAVGAALGITSDTNVPVIVRKGSVYTFLFKSTNGAVPAFTVGNGSVLQTYTVYKNGGYYFQVKAIGLPGQATGVYCNVPGRAPILVTSVTIN